MDPAKFIAKWNRAELSERAASQEHFLDLCKPLGVKTPAELDPVGDNFTFEKGVAVTGPASAGSGGQRGFADVWYKGHFGWEYKRKGKHKTLEDAYRQLLQYREDLENPPLLIVSDIDRTEIHTNFTNYRADTYVVELERLHEPENLDLLRRAFSKPESFCPKETTKDITKEVAKNIGTIARGLRKRGHDPHDAAHFLMKVMFCLFAEDVELLPKGIFQTILERADKNPARLKAQMDALFNAMRTGGDFGVEEIDYFNGGLFDDASAMELTEAEIDHLIKAAKKNWRSVEPVVFGTMFEQSLDPNKRAQIGAHYTSREDIMLVIEPIIVRPLRSEWKTIRDKCNAIIELRAKASRIEAKSATKKRAIKSATHTRNLEKMLFNFQTRLATAKILDPACGSGNFLYVAIQQLLALEKEVVTFAANAGTAMTPQVRPTQLCGIEINTYAAELAQVVIWIGYLQWMYINGFNAPRNPILEPIKSIENRDAILNWTTSEGEPLSMWEEGAVCAGQTKWPKADFIVGNPPFLGSRKARGELGNEYVDAYQSAFHDIPEGADLCCYWFYLSNRFGDDSARIGLLATQSIRKGSSRYVLDEISKKYVIFSAVQDQEWVLDGADVRISIVCFGQTTEPRTLDGLPCLHINSDLTAGHDTTTASKLAENKSISFQGTISSGPFDIDWETASEWLASPTVAGHPPSDVLRPWINATDITKRIRARWIIDFGINRSRNDAAKYDTPYEYLLKHVKPKRDKLKNGKPMYAHSSIYPTWQLWNTRHDLRKAIANVNRFVVTPRVAKHRVFSWVGNSTLPDARLFAFAISSEADFGVLHSSIHEVWTYSTCSWHGIGNDPTYNGGTCFETFPFPWPPGSHPKEGEDGSILHQAIADAANQLNEQRENWLNPPAWVAEVAAQVDAADDFADVADVSGEEARRLIRQSAIDAASAKHPKLKKRTLTNLYNDRPTWLRLAHRALDEAVLAADAHTDKAGNWDTSWAEVFEETGAGQPLPPQADGQPHALAERRAEVEQLILAALLRLNHERAGV